MEVERKDSREETGRIRNEIDRRVGIIEELLNGRIGGTQISWGMAALAAGAIWAGYELIGALTFFFGR